MSEVNIKDEKSKTIEVLQDAIVIYKDGLKELYDVIYIENKRIHTGHIFRDGGNEIFVCSGCIPKQNVCRIENGIKKNVFTQKL